MATAEVNNIMTLGGSVGSSFFNGAIIPLTDIQNWKTIGMGNDSVSASWYYAFSSYAAPSSQVVYSVPVGKTFYCVGFMSISANATGPIEFGYGDTAAADSSSTPTNAIYYANGSGNDKSTIQSGGTASIPLWFPIPMAFPSGKYPFLRPQFASAALRILLIGKEL